MKQPDSRIRLRVWPVLSGAALALVIAGGVIRSGPTEATQTFDDTLIRQSQSAADAKSDGCVDCHEGIEPMHESEAVVLGCTDCHGGDASVRASGLQPESDSWLEAKQQAHVQPLHPEYWSEDGRRTARNPERTYTQLNEESPEFIRFINPGDLRVAEQACGSCHPSETARVPRSTMATSAVFWAAAAYANGVIGQKYALLGEHYLPDGRAALLRTGEENIPYGTVPLLLPLPRWETTQPGEYFRAFERGGLLNSNLPPEIGNPNPFEEAGRPDIRSSNRGRGTGLRISPALINLHKTRLNDPHLSFLGTNDHPGDYRSSGCSGCHVVYANDRDPYNSGPYASAGHTGLSQTDDPMIPKDEKGHPIRHRLTRAIPTSQCMSCHMHQPNSFVNTYLGYTMWDYEADAEHFFPEEQRYPTIEERRTSLDHNPEGAAVLGLWTDVEFLEKSSELNPKLDHTQMADYHGHGWLFQAVYKRDRKGRLLDAEGNVVPFDDPEKFRKAVHLQDIHLEKGMHCVDCHFDVDSHGTGSLHGEFAATVEIDCRDCHGTVESYTNLLTSGPAAPPGGTDLSLATTGDGKRRFAWREGRLIQRSMVTSGLEWEVPQVQDTIDPSHSRYNEKSAYAKTILKDGATWGDVPADHPELAHRDEEMTCYSCHSAWVTNCFGCHLPQEANEKSKMLRYEGETTRNYASYNPQVVRWDAYMLGIEGNAREHRVSPVRSSSALILSSTNLNRERIYTQQATISAPGFSGQAMNTHVPHTVRSTETKQCTDCHVSQNNDNNAWMSQLLLQGTNFVNFMGRYVWVGEGDHGVEAVAVTEWDEPQAVIGSTLHRIVYPDFHEQHVARDRELQLALHHHGHELHDLHLRGEYLYTAQGGEGMIVYDVANIDNKGFSERIISAPVSPIGQRTQVVTRHATAIALPTNMPLAPGRKQLPINQEQPIHPIYQYAVIADREEGLIFVNVNTLSDGDPENNFLERALTFNPDDRLHGAEAVTIAGNHILVLADAGLVVIDAADPLAPRIVSTLPDIHEGSFVQVQFRYAFITDEEGLAVVDVTSWTAPRLVARVPIADAHRVYVARTYAYVAAGSEGMVIVDVERPDRPFIDQKWTGGVLKDTHDIKVASTNASLYAYVADGENGLFVLQLISPDTVPEYAGFSPRPSPRVIARRHTHGPALALSKPLDRDRGADESGNQVIVFNRIGARPMNLDEMRRLFMRDGRLYTVSDSPPARSSEGGGE
ncbi:MAG: hypothetical protein KY459_10990 [Acidobacteria bacterium]|nr:hypothetical protein [Acidobacteriota bacterium]